MTDQGDFLENTELDQIYIKSLLSLFKIRYSKYSPESSEYQILTDVKIPVISKTQMNYLNSNLKTTQSVKSILHQLNFRYHFDKKIIQKVFEMTEDGVNEIAVIIVFFQVIGRVYLSTDQTSMSSDDFLIIMQALNRIIETPNKDFLNSAFYITYLQSKLQKIKWRENSITELMMFFKINKSLTSNYYNILCNFFSRTIQIDVVDDSTNQLLSLLLYFFQNDYSVVNVSNHSNLLQLINPLIINFDRNAILIFAYILKKDNQDALNDFETLAASFAANLVKNAGDENKEIVIKPSEKISDYTSIQKDTSSFDYQIHEIDTMNNTFAPIDSELSQASISDLEKLIPNQTIHLINLLPDFFNKLDDALVSKFFTIVNQSVNQFQIDIYIAYLYLLIKLNNPKILKENIQIFFNSERATSTQEKVKFIYNTNESVFGPYTLDPTINTLRSIILSICPPDIVASLLKKLENYPFFMAEQIGRLALSYDSSNDDYFAPFNDQFVIRAISHEMNALQKLNAPSKPRNAFFIFFFNFYTDPNRAAQYLDHPFVNILFPFLFETGVQKRLFEIVEKAFLFMRVQNESAGKALKFLFEAVNKNNSIAQNVYTLISHVAKFRPFLLPKLRRFLPCMIHELNVKRTKEAFDNALVLTSLLANYDFRNRGSFEFSPKSFFIIASNIQFASFPMLFNMILGGNTFNLTSLALIRQPEFLPLLVISQASDKEKMKNLIELFLTLAKTSEANCRAMHDGDLDLIFIKHLNDSSMISYNGFKFTMNIDEKVINTSFIDLLYLIIESKSSISITKEIMTTIINKKQIILTKLVNNILCKFETLPEPSFPIGTLSPFCTIHGLNHKIIRNDISFTFWLKTDLLLLQRSTAAINIVSIIDQSQNSFNIVFQNNTLNATFEGPRRRTIVSLCNRMNNNVWTHFGIVFANNPNERPMLYTYKDYERLHDSEFCPVEFASGQLAIQFGGHNYGDRAIIAPNQQIGQVSRIQVFNRQLEYPEIFNIKGFDIRSPTDYVVSSCDFKPKMINSSVTVPYNLQISKSKSKPFPLEYKYELNHCNYLNLKYCLSNNQMIETIVESIRNSTSRDFLNLLLSILEKIISFTKNSTISSRLASILLNMPQIIDLNLFKMLCAIVDRIKDKKIQNYWIEDVLMNIPIWKQSNEFHSVLYHYSFLLSNYKLFSQHSYFFYFLNQFDQILKDKNEKAIRQFARFLERLAYIKRENNNDLCIFRDDANDLISFATKAQDDDKVLYLKIITRIAKPILLSKFTDFNYIYHFLTSDNIEIVTNAILALHELQVHTFHTHVFAIMNAVKVPLNELFDKLGQHVNKFQSLFSLICAISLQINVDPTKYMPNSLLKSYLSSEWYVLPLLVAMQQKDNTKIVNFIAIASLLSDDILNIIVFLTYLNHFGEQVQSTSNNNILQLYLHRLAYNAKSQLDEKKLYNVFISLFISFFFKLESRPLNKELISLMQDFEYKPANGNDQIKKIKIVDFDSLQQFILQVKSLQDLVTTNSNRYRSRQTRAQHKREQKMQNNEPISEDEAYQYWKLDSQVSSIKSFLLYFNYNKEDLDILRKSLSIFVSKLTKYKLGKDVQFNNEDISNLIQNFLEREEHVPKNSDLPQGTSGEIEESSSADKGSEVRIQKERPSSVILTQTSSLLDDSLNKEGQHPRRASSITKNNPVADEFAKQLNLCSKSLFIFEYYMEYATSLMLSDKFDKQLSTIINKLDKGFDPIVNDQLIIKIDTENQRVAKHRQLIEKSVKLVRNPNVSTAMNRYLMKRVKKELPILRYIEQTTHEVACNAFMISFNDKKRILFSKYSDSDLKEARQSNHPPNQLPQPLPQKPTFAYVKNALSKIGRTNSVNQPTTNIISDACTYTMQMAKSTISIKESQIANIFYIDDFNLDIITTNNKSYQIRYADKEKMAEFVASSGFKITQKNVEDLATEKRRQWESGAISTFTYISFLNFLSGRTYEDCHRYPVFPSLTEFKDSEKDLVPSLDRTFFNLDIDSVKTPVQIDGRLFVLPELYYLFESDSVEDVYNRRKKLEEISKDSKNTLLLKWLDTVFGSTKFIHRRLFTKSHKARSIFNRQQESMQAWVTKNQTDVDIIYAIPYLYDSSFCYVTSKGEVRFVQIEYKEQPVIKEINQLYSKGRVLNDIRTLSFAPLATEWVPDFSARPPPSAKIGIIAYNKSTVNLVTTSGTIITKENMYIERPMFHNAVFLTSPSTLSLMSAFFNESDKNPLAYPFMNIHSKVTVLKSSTQFGIIVIGSIDGKIRIRSLEDGKKIATVTLDDGQVPTKILITKSWGFIVVYCVSMLYVISINGQLIKKCNNIPAFRKWFTFRTSDDFDYIGFLDKKENSLSYFEVMYPENIKCHIKFRTAQDIVSIQNISYDVKQNLFVILNQSGKITFHPFRSE